MYFILVLLVVDTVPAVQVLYTGTFRNGLLPSSLGTQFYPVVLVSGVTYGVWVSD